MKRLFLFLAACAFAVACEPDTRPGTQPDPQPEVKVEFKIISPSPMELDAEGGDCVIRYTIDEPDESLKVSVSTDVDWITETDATYAAENEIVLVVQKNDGDAREATVAVTYDKQYEVIVHQAAAAVEPEPEPKDVIELPFLSAIYFGNMYGATENDYNYSIVLGTSENVLDIITGEYAIYPHNTYLLLDLFSDQPSENYSLSFDIPAGEYSLDQESTCQAGTVSAEYSSLFLAGETDGEEIFFVEGTVTVTEDSITAELIAEDGTEYKFFTPAVSVDNTGLFKAEGLPGEYSTLEGDLHITFEDPVMYLENYGDYYVVGKNTWLMYLGDNALSHSLGFEFLLPYEDEAPVGEFKVTSDLTCEQLILPGFVSDSGESMWSWYIDFTEDGSDFSDTAPIVDGTVTITDNGDETYTAICDLVDDLGNRITCECTASMEILAPFYRKTATKARTPLKRHLDR